MNGWVLFLGALTAWNVWGMIAAGVSLSGLVSLVCAGITGYFTYKSWNR
jgi:D-arabinose 1-dehydrogenase-like Zn-dependent alcohol dehydrogenase